MRYLILSDIHANCTALHAVLADAAGRYDAIVNCGDIVGYGPEPNEAVSICREKCVSTVRGNHDKAAVGLADLDWFNAVARTAAEWTHAELTSENRDWLAALQQGPVEFAGFSLVHGSPYDEDEYVVDVEDVRYASEFSSTGLTFFGHTHLQGAFEVHRNGIRDIPVPDFTIEETSAYFVNPGSVGQPRDNDPRAAYAIYDAASRSVEIRRVEYDVDRTYHQIVSAGLPEVLGLRLYRGV